MRRDSVLSLVGIAKKAGKVAAGEFQTEQAVSSGRAGLVIVSEEASENTKKKFRNMCDFYRIPVFFYGGKEQLGTAIGCEFRASLAITDEGLSRSIEKKLLQFTKNQGVYCGTVGEDDPGGGQEFLKSPGMVRRHVKENEVDGNMKVECEGREV